MTITIKKCVVWCLSFCARGHCIEARSHLFFAPFEGVNFSPTNDCLCRPPLDRRPAGAPDKVTAGSKPRRASMLRFYVASTNTARSVIARLGGDVSGVTAIEYGLIAGAIAVAIIATVIALGGDISNLFGKTGSALSSVSGSSL
jgi:pilus assembly protein Flp/PilA